MLLKFESLVLHNFLSFGDVEVNLDDQGYVLVKGTNNCKLDNAKSNGSGKSSIWEAIVWAITGDTIRGTKDVINKYGSNGTYVEIVFKVDSDTYKIIRYKEYSNIGTNLKVFINGEDKSGKGIRDTEKLLEQYLPDVNSSLIGSVIILGQGLPQRFTNNTPSGRKEVLEKLSKSDFMINDIKDRLSNRKLTLSTELRQCEDLLLELESKKSVYLTQLDKDTYELNNLVSISDINFEFEINNLDTKISKCEDEITIADENITDANNALQESRLKYSTLDSELKGKQLDISAKYDRNELVKERYSVGSRISQLEKNINDARNIKDTCPTCGQKLPDVHKIDTSDLEKELDALLTEDKRLANLIDLSKLNESKEIEDLQKSYEELKNTLLEEGKKDRQLYDDLVKSKNSITKVLSELKLERQSLLNKQSNYLNNKSRLEMSIENTTKSIDKISDDLLYNINVKDNIKSRLDIITKMLTIATRDFRGFLLSGVIDFINQKSKEYCKEIFDTEEIEFKLDGNNIFIGYCGKQYENLSGGEKQKIDLIVQFSIRDMLSQYLNFSSNILVVDEICDNLDSIGCQKVLNLIATKLTDVSSLFIISHHTDIDIPVDRELEIIKGEDGISKVG